MSRKMFDFLLAVLGIVSVVAIVVTASGAFWIGGQS